jgi:hypothetical protein
MDPRQAAASTASGSLERRGPPLGLQAFPDRTASFASALQAQAEQEQIAPLLRLYLAAFDRHADFEGFDYYVQERGGGASLASIAEEFANGSEVAMRYGNLDNAGFIEKVYRNVFDTPIDPARLAYLVAEMDAGRATRGSILLSFSETALFRDASANEVFVTLAYAQALSRSPQAAELARWVQLLDSGVSRDTLIAGLLGTTRTTR